MTRIVFTEHEVELPGGALVVRSAGAGHPILHLHSAGGPRISPVVEALAQRYRVLAPIAPGFSGTARSAKSIKSYADLLSQYLELEGGGAIDVIGQSFGGWVALWLAARHPDCVDHLVLEAPAGLRTPGAWEPRNEAERRRKLFVFPDRAPADTREPHILQGDQEVMNQYRDNVAFDDELANSLGLIKARTLVLMGAQDELIPAESGRLLKARVRQSHLIYIFKAAHALEIDQPERVFRVISDFLTRGEGFLVKASASA